VPITLSAQAFRRVTLAAATVTLSIVVAACGANFSAQTSQPYQPAEGTNATSGPIAVRNMLVLASADGKGELHAAIVNDGAEDDTLVSVESPTAAATPAQNGNATAETPATITVGNFRRFTLKPGNLHTLSPSTGQPVTVTGGKPGQMVKLTLTFAKAAPLDVTVPVLTLDHYSPSPRSDTSTAG
jgi:copper(I)-binding protein